jgi:hypothetical protein
MFVMKKRAYLRNKRMYGNPKWVTLPCTQKYTLVSMQSIHCCIILTKTEMVHQFLIDVSNLSFHENNAVVNALLKKKR